MIYVEVRLATGQRVYFDYRKSNIAHARQDAATWRAAGFWSRILK